MEKTKVGVIGATGMVGQNYIRLLDGHPWFEVTHVAASAASAGKTYEHAVSGRWLMDKEIPERVRDLVVKEASDIDSALRECAFVFSAVSLDKAAIRRLEDAYARAGLPVVSNNSAHRGTEDVPVFIPEINPHHAEVIAIQQRKRGWESGFIAVKPNCSVQSYMAPIHALRAAGFRVSTAVVTMLQGVSGAGYPGNASLDLIDNILPLIPGEEEKSELEPQKIFGRVGAAGIEPDESIRISAHCTRVPVVDGHTACVSLAFEGPAPPLDEIAAVWKGYRGLPQELRLPFAPARPIIVREEADRPQPRRDRNADKGMAVSVGRLRSCNVLDIRFVGLSHNTVRGAAGGGILNAELLKATGYL